MTLQQKKQIVQAKKFFLLDMDGTLYLDDYVFENCYEFLTQIKKQGGRYLFLTNNSSKSVDKYLEKMSRIGIPAVAEDFFTSVDATCVYLQQNYHGKKIYALGTTSFKEQLRTAGYPITDRLEEDIDCLLMGFDTELVFQKLEDACILLNRGVEYLATNPDLVCPTAYGYVPDCGSVSQMLYNATKRKPYFIGKPEPMIAQLAMKKYGAEPEETVLIGDRIYTDIACGVNAGITSILVFSGETTVSDWEKSDIKPSFTAKNISEIYHWMVEAPKA